MLPNGQAQFVIPRPRDLIRLPFELNRNRSVGTDRLQPLPRFASHILQERLAGRDITRLRSWERALLGIVYTFQVTSIYRKLSVHDNVALAAQRRRLRTPLDWIALDRRPVEAAVDAALAEVGLGDLRGQQAGALAYGHQRLVEVAMALALGPELLILDEPTQGLAGDEIEALCRLVRRIAGTTTVLLIEHNMSVVLELAGRVTVMDRGRILAEGTPAEIEAHPEVQRAYLGR